MTRRMRRLGALLAAPLFLAVASMAHVEGAWAQSSIDDTPSCSLHPDRLGDGLYSFTKDPALDIGNRRFLQIAAEDGTLLFNDWLEPGQTTPPLPLALDSVVTWSGHTYRVGAYALAIVNWCTDAEMPATTTTAAPAPEPPASEPAASEAPTTTSGPSPEVQAPATSPPDTTGTDAQPVAPVAVEAAAQDAVVAGVVAVRDDAPAAAPSRSLPVTGAPLRAWALVGSLVAALGGVLVAFAHRRGQNGPVATCRSPRP